MSTHCLGICLLVVNVIAVQKGLIPTMAKAVETVVDLSGAYPPFLPFDMNLRSNASASADINNMRVLHVQI